MSHGDRIRELREHLGLVRQAFADETGLKRKTIENLEQGLQQVYAWHLEAIGKRWPEYRYWLLTGETLEMAGQISPNSTKAEKD